MDDLFRFVLLRPADAPDSTEIKMLDPPSLDGTRGAGVARRRAAQLLRRDDALRRTDDLAYASAARAVAAELAGGARPAAAVRSVVEALTGIPVAEIVADDAFTRDEGRLADVLVATKLVSDSSGTDARALATAARGYDALRALAEGADPVALRPLSMPTWGDHDRDSGAREPAAQIDRPHAGPTAPAAPTASPAKDPDPANAAEVERLDAALAELGRLRAGDFLIERDAPPHGPATGDVREARAARPEAREGREPTREQPNQPAPRSAELRSPWQLSETTVGRISPAVRATIANLDLDLGTDPLPSVMRRIHDARTELLTAADARMSVASEAIVAIGSSFLGTAAASDYVGPPATSMPTGHGTIRPVGIGDLLLVRQHVLRYEGGEVGHIENVLKTERLNRETRRLDRTETTVLTESETTREDERDVQSTDRFSLKRETSQTLKQDTEFKAGVSVDAKYGPFVEVKANADFSTKSSSEESAKQASEFSKDVVARSVSKVIERVLERRSTTTINEFEEKYSHGFDNTTGGGNVSGVYQWVDKVMQAQVYNYGKRLLFDVTVPEPGTAFITAQNANAAEGEKLTKPVPFTLTADQITEANYTVWAHRYDVTGLEAPPPPVRTVSKAFDAVVNQSPYESSKSQDLAIDDGYVAKYALFQCGFWYYPNSAAWHVMIGSNWVDAINGVGYVDMAGEVGSVSVAYFGHGMRNLAATVEIFCERTPRAYKVWQLKAHAAITQGYLANVQAYESALAEAAAKAGVVIAGRNPAWNQRITSTELRKQCLTMITAQHFDSFGALSLSGEGYPQPHLARAAAQMPYVRFFEQAFEWEHLVHFFYPYFWGWKPGWSHRMLLDDVDPLFADFLRAGAARVVFPVRPGFEAAVLHYLETGEIWAGGPAPDVTDPLYVPIIKEIQEATGAPGNEVPQGEPWLVHLPTTLAKLRPNDDLPSWTKVGDDWQPVV